MNKRLKVLHIINSLTIGGAETLLVNSLSKGGLQCYTQNTLVYFQGTSTLEKKIDPDVKVICLEYKGAADLPRTLKLLRKIVKDNKVDIVHSHLSPAGVYTRIALPKKTKQVHTLHSTYSANRTLPRILLQLEKSYFFTHKSVSLIFLSEVLKNDFLQVINFKGKTFILNNFIDNIFFNPSPKIETGSFKVVAVGNLNPPKNYRYLFEIFKFLKDTPVSLDIYGGGDIEKHQLMITENNLNIKLMGQQQNINEVLLQYDLFVMASTSEGSPISVMEAMASGLPCLLSDIDSLRNTSAGNAVYFSLNDARKAAGTIKAIVNKEVDIAAIAQKAKEYAEKFRRENYIEKLLTIYQSI